MQDVPINIFGQRLGQQIDRYGVDQQPQRLAPYESEINAELRGYRDD